MIRSGRRVKEARTEFPRKWFARSPTQRRKRLTNLSPCPRHRARDTVRAGTKRGMFSLSSLRTYGARVSSTSEYVTSMSLRFRASIRKATCICLVEAGKRRKGARPSRGGQLETAQNVRVFVSFAIEEWAGRRPSLR